MMRFLRSQSQTVLVLILIVIGASFLFYGNVGNLVTGSGGRGNDFGRIDGQELSVAELYDAVRTTRDSWIMNGRAQDLSQPGGHAALAQDTWRRLLLLHQADLYHIQISDQELIDLIQRQPNFQKDGVYSPELYQKEMAQLDSTFHISPDAFEKVVRDQLRLEVVSVALLSTVRTSSGNVSEQYDKYEGSAQVSVVSIDPKTVAASVQVTPDEIEAEYKAHPDNPAFRTAEKRKVDYVFLALAPDQAKLPAKEKAAAIETLGEKALDFALALQPDPNPDAHAAAAAPDFATEAKAKGMTVLTTDFFSADTPPAGMPPSPAFNNAAFTLNKENPVSNVVELDNGVAVLHLNALQVSDLKPLEQVKGDIVHQLQQTKEVQQARLIAQITAQVLRAQVAKGVAFKTAAAAQKLTVQVLPPFVPAKVSQEDNRLDAIAYTSIQLAVGAVSGPVPIESDNSIVIVHLDRRDPADPAGLADFSLRFREKQDDQIRNLVYVDMANWLGQRSGTRPPPDLDQYGGVE